MEESKITVYPLPDSQLKLQGNFMNIQGTKTFNDAQSGKILLRQEELFKKYQKNLPFW